MNDVFECFEIGTKWVTKRPHVSVDMAFLKLLACLRNDTDGTMQRSSYRTLHKATKVHRAKSDIQRLIRTVWPFASENNNLPSPSNSHRILRHCSASLLNQDDGVRCNVKRGLPEITEQSFV